MLALAELRSAEIGVDADRVLIAQGHLSEERYLAALAVSLGVGVELLDARPREVCPLRDDQLIGAANAGMLPLHIGGELIIVVAPELVGTRALIRALRVGARLTRRIRITSSSRLRQFVTRHAEREIGQRAAEQLRTTRPDLSAGTRRRRSPRLVITAALLAPIATIALLVPYAMLFAVELALGLTFLAWTGLRVFGMVGVTSAPLPPPPPTDDRLPIYTIIIALYREAAAVRGLVAALQRLDYPPEKLQIMLVLEADDYATRRALDRLHLTAPFEIIVAPPVGPRTKPKALNAALPFARGMFVAVYDAEDRLEPDQLRRAIDAFASNDAKLGCVQARLTIDNTADSWLARLFTAEYAGLFDVFLPGLAVWRLPLPLGGSSNHFRTSMLREIGAWDPHNVTEDADLGIRMARMGYRAAVIDSTTYEEAPARFGAWIKQRTRWFKGWMQTWLVHMRSPRRLWRELGLSGFVVFQLVVGGTALAALVHAFFAAQFIWEVATGQAVYLSLDPVVLLHETTLVIGYTVSTTLALIGLWRRRLLGVAWVLLLMPLHWLLLSLAAMRALLQLLLDPFRWEKTEHGLARSSRFATGGNRRRTVPRT